jgi:hypothetical protein
MKILGGAGYIGAHMALLAAEPAGNVSTRYNLGNGNGFSVRK